MSGDRKISFNDDPVIGPQLDITAPECVVQVEINGDGSILWVNIDGVARLRVSRMTQIEIIDHRRK